MPATPKKSTKTKTTSTYTYTGCWTCRRRHIKCGEEKPECQRCVKAGFECGGYDFRFGGLNSSRSFRRPLAQGSTQRQPALSDARVSGILEQLELATDSTQEGPFSVLSFGNTQSYDESLGRKLESEEHSGNVDLGVRTRGNDGLFDPPIDSEDVKAAVTSRAVSPSMLREPHLLSMPALQSELFEHWTTFLCDEMSPLSKVSPTNPFRYLYPSLALEGMMATVDVGSPRLAVLHALCATAAWSLARMKPNNRIYQTLSVNHDRLALNHIQQSIASPDGMRDGAIPAAIMTCLTGDVLSGRLELWGQHLRGGFQCLLHVLRQRHYTDSTLSALCEQYLISAAFAKFGTASDHRILRRGILNENLYIENCHCITRQMVDVVLAINSLVASNGQTEPSEVEKVRRQLASSVPRFDHPTRHHISHAFYYAITIYFTREVLQSKDTHELAWRAIQHLNWASDTGQGNIGKILMWPLFTIGVECTTPELRASLLAWCNSQLLGHVGDNIDKFVSLLKQTWSFQSPNLSYATNVPTEQIKTEASDEVEAV